MPEYQPYVLFPDTDVGHTLKQLRTAANVTAGRMAQVMDCDKNTITRWEGKDSPIKLSKAVEYLDYLGIDVSVRYRT